jgi:folate-binding protein YgfZ
VTTFWCENPRDVLRITGADALSYLQSQISQDIRGLTDGTSAYTFVLQPAGKVDALARVTRVSADELLLDTDAGFGDVLSARLNRFKIRVKVDISVLPWACIAVRDAAAPVPGGLPAWGRADAFDLVGENPEPPAGARHGTTAELLIARLETGWPAMGAEITEATIPAETGVVGFAVNFTKGCYPGQELVERMDSRGSAAPRFVRRLRGEGSAAVGDEVSLQGKAVGALTSVADTDAGWVALASIARAAQPGAAVTIATADGPTDSVVESTLELTADPATAESEPVRSSRVGMPGSAGGRRGL